MKATFDFNFTRAEIKAMRSFGKKTNGALGAFDLPTVKITPYDQLKLALGGQKTFKWSGNKDGVKIDLEATASKKGLYIAIEAEVHEAYLVETYGLYEDAIDTLIPAIVAAVGGFVGASKIFEAKAEKRVKRLRKAIK